MILALLLLLISTFCYAAGPVYVHDHPEHEEFKQVYNEIHRIDSRTGTSTNDDAEVGEIGEYIEGLQTTLTNFPASGTLGDLASVYLTAGDWDVTAMLDAQPNGATTTTMDIGISVTSGNSATGLTSGVNRFFALGPTSATGQPLYVPAYRMSLASATTAYLKYEASYSVATPQARGRISARRVR